MKQKTKNILVISSGLLALAALLLWYFYPIVMYEWLVLGHKDNQHYLRMTPKYISSLPPAPGEWPTIEIAGLSFKIPIAENKKIKGGENYIYFIADAGSLVISDITPPKDLLNMIKEGKLEYPYVSYQERIAMAKSVPSDISLLNPRGRNVQAAINQYLKFLNIPLGGMAEIDIVESRTLKAIIIKSEYGATYNYSANVAVYNHNETMSFDLLFMNYKDRDILDTQMLQILGTVKLPSQRPDIEKVTKDIKAIAIRYKKTEQPAPLDRE